MLALLLVLLLIALIVLPRLLGASLGAVVESLFGKGERTYAARRTVHARFVSTLDPSSALKATENAAATLSGSLTSPDPSLGRVTVVINDTPLVSVSFTAGPEGGTQLGLSPASGQADPDSMARFRGALLAALRQHDPQAHLR